MSRLVNHLKEEFNNGVLTGVFPKNLGMQRFKKAEGSSLTDNERNLPDGKFLIKEKNQKIKFFVKTNGQWYSYTEEKEKIPIGIMI